MRDIGAEGGKDTVCKENPVHPGNLPEGPIDEGALAQASMGLPRCAGATF
jgi:hypothetical protein